MTILLVPLVVYKHCALRVTPEPFTTEVWQ